MLTDDRFTRQADLVPRAKILETRVTIIGVGSLAGKRRSSWPR